MSRVRSTAIWLFMLWSTSPAWSADAAEPFTLGASYVLSHDSNLFRLADNVSPVIDGVPRKRSESLNTLSLTGSFDTVWSRQRFTGTGEFRILRFNEFTYLNYQAANYQVQWDWQIGRRWSGMLGYLRAEQGRSFADFVFTTQSINTYGMAFASADLTLPSYWKVGGTFASVSSRFNDALSAAEEYDEDSLDVHVSLRSASANELTLALRRAEAIYANRPVMEFSDNAYVQTDLRLQGTLQLTQKTALGGYAGLARREFPTLPSRNYAGPIARIEYRWSPTSKLLFESTLRRELGAREDIAETFAVTTAAELRLEWQLRPKFGLAVQTGYQSRDFGGDPGTGVTSRSGETDRQWSNSLTVNYDPLMHLKLFFTADGEMRNAGEVIRRYESLAYRLGVRAYL